MPLKTISDYVRHRSPQSTRVYGKVAIETLREVALGDARTCCKAEVPPHGPALCAGPLGGNSLAGSG